MIWRGNDFCEPEDNSVGGYVMAWYGHEKVKCSECPRLIKVPLSGSPRSTCSGACRSRRFHRLRGDYQPGWIKRRRALPAENEPARNTC